MISSYDCVIVCFGAPVCLRVLMSVCLYRCMFVYLYFVCWRVRVSVCLDVCMIVCICILICVCLYDVFVCCDRHDNQTTIL